jgi:methylglutaconyl-CoA hydratase
MFRRYFSVAREVQLQKLGGAHQGIVTLSLNRPAANALGSGLLREFKDALNHIRTDESARVLVLDSKIEKVFCAGADLKERAKMTTDQVQDFVSELRKTFTALESLPIPTISVINGVQYFLL